MKTPTYHKIDSVFKRDPDNNYRTFLMGEWARPEFGYLVDATWVATEKVDGTNIRIHIGDGGETTHGGRTERAEIHPELTKHLIEVEHRAAESELDGLTLYGEGYGEGIQKGGKYRPDKGFVLFDVMETVSGMYLKRGSVRAIAATLGMQVVPETFRGTLNAAVHHFASGRPVNSSLFDGEAEGWVLRPAYELFDRGGNRIITKLKVKDFPERQ